MLSIIVAVADNGVVGKKNSMLPWHLKADLLHFKHLTTGHPIIMGRKTFETLPHALPNRRNIVITHSREFIASDVEVAHSLDEAIRLVENDVESFIIGGGKIIEQTTSLVSKIYLTEVHARPRGDTYLKLDRTL